jgi:ubiquinone/menaquinone biosynthesis C-methylase UbiE
MTNPTPKGKTTPATESPDGNRLSRWELIKPREARVRVAFKEVPLLVRNPHPNPLPEGEGLRMRMDSSWLFNLGADIYGWFTAQAAWRASCTQMAGRLDGLDRPWIADLGCGPGVSTFELARHLPAARLIGLDIAPRMLGEARRRRRTADVSSTQITWLQADAARLAFNTASLDACTGHSFLYLVADRRAVLSEIRRVLKPGGRLILMEPNERAATIAQALRVSTDPRHLVSVSLWRPFSRLHGRFTPATLSATLERAGFVNCQSEETLGGLGLLASAVSPGQ